MKKLVWLLLALYSTAAHAQGQSNAAICARLDGALIVADDGHFLGKLASSYAPDSIYNSYGNGSPYNADSVWNAYGLYGSAYGVNSARNPSTSTPPMLIKGRQVIGALTENRSFPNGVSPVAVGIACYNFKPPG